jgi:hypothetical protein
MGAFLGGDFDFDLDLDFDLVLFFGVKRGSLATDFRGVRLDLLFAIYIYVLF